MAKQKLTIEAKKDFAKVLYTKEQLDGKVVAERVGVTEKTISKWVNEGNWRKLRSRLSTSKEAQLELFYEQIEALNIQIGTQIPPHADSKQADILVKYTSAIKALENDLGIGDLVEAGTRFIKHIQSTESHDKVMDTMEMWNGFLASAIKNK